MYFPVFFTQDESTEINTMNFKEFEKQLVLIEKESVAKRREKELERYEFIPYKREKKPSLGVTQSKEKEPIISSPTEEPIINSPNEEPVSPSISIPNETNQQEQTSATNDSTWETEEHGSLIPDAPPVPPTLPPPHRTPRTPPPPQPPKIPPTSNVPSIMAHSSLSELTGNELASAKMALKPPKREKKEETEKVEPTSSHVPSTAQLQAILNKGLKPAPPLKKEKKIQEPDTNSLGGLLRTAFDRRFGGEHKRQKEEEDEQKKDEESSKNIKDDWEAHPADVGKRDFTHSRIKSSASLRNYTVKNKREMRLIGAHHIYT